MSAGAMIAEDDWTGRPATKGDLILVQTDLEKVKSDLEHKIDLAVANLDVKIAEGHRSQARTTWLAVATLGAVGIMLQFF